MEKRFAAKTEALARKRDNSRLNPIGGQCEWAYSPSTGAVGMREACPEPRGNYRIINVHYPMYGKAELVNDWVSVGDESPRLGFHWAMDNGVMIARKDVEGETYRIDVHGSKVPV